MTEARSPEPPLALIRPAVELAWWVAKLGAQARPSIDPPGRLRPFLRAAKLPDRVLSTIRQVVDTDDEFRARVAGAADEEEVGRGSWLWLVRPEGWEAELEALASEAGDAGSERDLQARVRRLERALERADADLMRARAELAALRQANEALTADARGQERLRRQAERDRDRAQTAVHAAESERRRLEDEAEQLRLDAASAPDTSAGPAAEAAVAREELRQAEAEVARLEAELVRSRESEAGAAATLAEFHAFRTVVTDALSRAAQVATELGKALVVAGAAAPAPVELPGPDAGNGRGPEQRSGSGRPVPPARSRPARGDSRRRTVPLPPAVLDDSPEAAAHLVRTPGILLIVDGYNVTLSSWPGLDLPDQRQRLVDAVAELTSRAGTTAHVVFDGVSAGNRVQPPAVARRQMRVEFSPSEIEADELIISLIGDLDADHPVVVATDDRRVRQEAAHRGANVISVEQLLAVLGRSGWAR